MTDRNGTSVTEQELNAEMLATISHELRTPLTSIKGYATTLMRGGKQLSPLEAQEYLQAIEEGCERLNVIIEHFLELSQFETHMVTLSLTRVDLLNFLQQFVFSYKQITLNSQGSKDIQLSLTLLSEQADGKIESYKIGDPSYEDENDDGTTTLALHPDDPLAHCVIYANIDLRYMQKALLYLLDNAIKYSSEHGMIDFKVRLLPPTSKYSELISTTEAYTASDYEKATTHDACALSIDKDQSQLRLVEISIQDHGIGIESDQLEHIFERFYRVDQNLTREVNGLGIGLTICKHIIELHSGSIWVESEPGRGSIFHILLPVSLWSDPVYQKGE